jgi:hypothetical protein
MQLRTKLEIAGAVIVFLSATWVSYSIQRAHERNAVAAAAEAANKNAAAILREHDAQAKAERDAAVAALQAQLDAVNKRLDTAKTPQDLAPIVEALMKLKQPITFVTPEPTAANPHPEPVAQVPESDAPQVKEYVRACETCKFELESAHADLKLAQSQLADANQKFQLASDDAARWKKAAQGGSVFQRIKHDSKAGLIGGAITVIVLCATGHCPK